MKRVFVLHSFGTVSLERRSRYFLVADFLRNVLNNKMVGADMEFSDEKIRHYRSLIIRCPRLGGEVPFSYCEKEAGDLPCPMVANCWTRIFPIEEYLQHTLTAESLGRLYNQSAKDRMGTILGIAAAVKKR
jgi:hypothetical protein